MRGPDLQCANFSNICLGADRSLSKGYWANNGNSSITSAALCTLDTLNLRNANGSLFQPVPSASCPGLTAVQITTGRTAVAAFLNGATATNMANMLSAQLAAMELNILINGQSASAQIYSGPSSCIGNPPLSSLGIITLSDLISNAMSDLGAHGSTPAGNQYRACQEYKKNAFDNADNNLNFVLASCRQPGPELPRAVTAP